MRGVKLSHLAWHSCVLPKQQYTFNTKFNLKALLSRNTYNFQQWMSRLPQRWWTQRNAIRNANCKTSWIIKILNAHCAFGIYLRAYLFEYLWTPLNPTLWCLELDYGTELFLSSLLKYRTGFPSLCYTQVTITMIHENFIGILSILVGTLHVYYYYLDRCVSGMNVLLLWVTWTCDWISN